MNLINVICFVSIIAINCINSGDSRVIGEDTKIVNGYDAERGQFPHQVSLRRNANHQHYCAGSIISDRWILTAAHCVELYRPPYIYAVVGSIDRRHGLNIDLIYEVRHPNHTVNVKRFDIALLRTGRTIPFDSNIQPIALPTADITDFITAYVSGWGATHFATPPSGRRPPRPTLPNQLQFLKTQTLSTKACVDGMQDYAGMIKGVDMNATVCTKRDTVVPAGNCFGDSGGPLITEDKILIGVVSWGIPCAQGYPDFYSKVYSFLDFINSALQADL